MSASRVATIDLSAESVRTGEAVELDIIPAEPPYRFASAFVDFAAYGATAVTVLYVVMRSWRHPTAQQEKIFTICLIASATLLVPLAVEALTRGSSLGKWAFSLRAVRDDGGPVSLRHIFVRRLVGVIELALFALPTLVSMFLTTRGKRLGDLAAGTIVVRQPTGAIHPPLLMPPALAAWASTAVVLPVDGALRREALAFLRVNAELAPAVRAAGGADLAMRLRAYAETPIPAGAHPEQVIAAILVVGRDKDWRRERTRVAAAQERLDRATAGQFGIPPTA
ncbi:MAG: RDD family protein [Schaalia georgiae]|uniref:RDD family protein n=1 Tax=Schaalia georgiae TaxID=52768 RepID=A0A929N2G8_9ACTO|nr:RDD family protein [Schaalia georgiae]